MIMSWVIVVSIPICVSVWCLIKYTREQEEKARVDKIIKENEKYLKSQMRG